MRTNKKQLSFCLSPTSPSSPMSPLFGGTVSYWVPEREVSVGHDFAMEVFYYDAYDADEEGEDADDEAEEWTFVGGIPDESREDLKGKQKAAEEERVMDKVMETSEGRKSLGSRVLGAVVS